MSYSNISLVEVSRIDIMYLNLELQASAQRWSGDRMHAGRSKKIAPRQLVSR